MKHLFVLMAIALGLAGCNTKPEAGDCRRAINRIRELTGTANIQGAGDIEAAVRSCRGNASKESVRCAMEASSIEQLERCGLVGKEELEVIKLEQDEELARQKKREQPVDAGAPAGDAAPNATADAGAAPAAATDAGAAPASAGSGSAAPSAPEPTPK